MGARCFLEENRLAADAAKGANRRIDAAGYVLAGFLVQAHMVTVTELSQEPKSLH
jgi:hypothetical protein